MHSKLSGPIAESGDSLDRRKEKKLLVWRILAALLWLACVGYAIDVILEASELSSGQANRTQVFTIAEKCGLTIAAAMLGSWLWGTRGQGDTSLSPARRFSSTILKWLGGTYLLMAFVLLMYGYVALAFSEGVWPALSELMRDLSPYAIIPTLFRLIVLLPGFALVVAANKLRQGRPSA